MSTRSARLPLLLAILVGLGLAACASPDGGVAREREGAEETSELTASQHDTQLREAIELADPAGLWIRCQRGRGESKMTFDIVGKAGSSRLDIHAGYFGADYNARSGGGPRVEVSASLGQAKLTNTDLTHRSFAFEIRGETATLDAFAESGDVLRFRGHDYRMSCQSFDF
jgi:hypothetical protein